MLLYINFKTKRNLGFSLSAGNLQNMRDGMLEKVYKNFNI